MEKQENPLLFDVIVDKNFNFSKECDIYLIRHGVTERNIYYQIAYHSDTNQKEKDADLKNIILNSKFIDISLHKWGKQQSESLNKSYYQQLQNQTLAYSSIKVIFLSPLKRVIDTAFTLFFPYTQFIQSQQNVNNFCGNGKKLEFIFLPELSESLSSADDICGFENVGNMTNYIMNNYGQYKDFFNLDIEFLKNDNLWCLNNLNDNNKNKEQIIEKLTNETQNTLVVQQAIFQQIKNIYPSNLEQGFDFYVRVQKAKSIIKQFILNSKINLKGQICVISHYETIINFTTSSQIQIQNQQQFDQNCENLFKDSLDADNCDVFPYKLFD